MGAQTWAPRLRANYVLCAPRFRTFLAEDQDSEPQSEIPGDARSDEEPDEPDDVTTTDL